MPSSKRNCSDGSELPGSSAKALFKEWYDKLADQKNCGGSSFAGIATKMDRYCGRLALCYYFLACGTKAHRNFYTSPVETLPSVQKSIYEALPLVSERHLTTSTSRFSSTTIFP
ncbi:MAG: hypothetical protein MJY49_05230, partial [Bacteroidales bacterium]|nr:hypothetical protein [Bacteroidales bacterium]